jgi:O-methyltransferase domain/Dimerisation domain
LKESVVSDAANHVMDLIFGRWRSQILFAGAELGIFDRLDKTTPRTAGELATALGLDEALLYRLLRAQAAIGLLAESPARQFTLTEAGDLLRAEHPRSLAAMARLEEGPQHYALWKHLPAMIRDGRQNAFQREFGQGAFDHARIDHDYAARFDQAMTSYSAAQSAQVLAALDGVDLSGIRTFCDVAGGHGYMTCALLGAYPQLSGIVFDLPAVVADRDALWASKLGLEHRCRYVGGDMFKDIPKADAYGLKMILHDWNDAECVAILENIRRAAGGPARVFIMEHVVPDPGLPHFAKLFDIHMMCWGTGQERTEAEYGELLRHAGWRKVASHHAPSGVMGVIEGASG